MIEVEDFLEKEERADLLSFESFLDAAGVEEDDYAIVSGYDVPDAICAIDYAPTEDGVTFCKIRFPMHKSEGVIEQWLGDAGWFLCFLMTSGWLEKTRALSVNATAAEVFGTFDLDKDTYLRTTKMKSSDEDAGPYILREDDGYSYYMFDDTDELALNAVSAELAPLVVRLAVDLHVDETDFLEALAEHYDDGEDGQLDS